MNTPLDRELLKTLESRVLQAGSYFKPELRLYAEGEQRFVVKDSFAMNRVIKALMGRRTVRREVRIYKRLKGVRGVPQFLGSIDSDAFTIEFVEGETLHRSMGPERLGAALSDLEAVMAGIHALGIVHLDLKQKRNVLVQPDNCVTVVDFQSAFCFNQSLLGRIMLALLQKRDLAGIIKFRGRYIPETLTSKQLRSYNIDRQFARLWPFTHLVRICRKLFKSDTSR